ncbi:MAG TPA: trypsin-like peptidase domain-containing protein [Candidatus Limnocylindrales bacterium]|nr:trypsin-like peptidase domain-containing protein [Candidatus Limnocylindrales bacterium]
MAASPPASGGTALGGSADDGWARIPKIIAQVEPAVTSILQDNGEGSGVVWNADGVVVTNNHVVEGVDQVIVAYADGKRADGKVLATDPLSDIAIVQTDRKDVPPAAFAAEVPPVGSMAIALGNPLGFENSATVGIISGNHRSIPGAASEAPALVDLIQTDAAISPGNSGGALVGEDTKVIGINVAYIPPSAGSVSIGFAIPAPTVIDVVDQLLKTGRAQHAYLGVLPVPLTPEIVKQFGIQVSEGALIVEVPRESPADKAGIRPGDVVVAIGDTKVSTVEDLLAALRHHRPGDKVPVKIVRNGEEQTIEVTLGDFPATPGQ